MKAKFSSSLGGRRQALIAMVAVLLANECVCLPMFLLDVTVARLHPELGLSWGLAPLGGVVVLNTWLLYWSGKTLHFMAAYGAWPAAPASDRSQAEEHSLLAAAAAFDQGDFSKVPGLLARIPEDRWAREQWLGLGRAQAMAGNSADAIGPLERGGEAVSSVRWLKAGSTGLSAAPHFGDGTADRLNSVGRMGALAAALVLASVGVSAGLFVGLERSRVAAEFFNKNDFQVEVQGRFTIHYHDPDYRDRTEAVASSALDHDLEFLGMPADTFGPGAIHLYLCDTEAEYRRRAPSLPSWEIGCAVPADSSIYLYRFDAGVENTIYSEIVMAHELGHLCYYRLIGRSPDDWLNEGLADYLGYHFGLARAGIPSQAWLQNRFFTSLRTRALPFSQFFTVDPHQLPADDVGVFYQQGFSVVYLLVEDYGRVPFLKFLSLYTRSPDMNAALAGSFPTIPTVGALATVWGLFYPKDQVTPQETPTQP